MNIFEAFRNFDRQAAIDELVAYLRGIQVAKVNLSFVHNSKFSDFFINEFVPEIRELNADVSDASRALKAPEGFWSAIGSFFRIFNFCGIFSCCLGADIED